MEPEQDDGERPFLAGRLAEDPELLGEVETAERLGVSLKRFQGWEPITVYTHRAGRLASSQPEVEWDDQQRGWMLALQMHRASLCPGCGGNLAVTTAPENEDRFRAELPLTCFRCVGFGRSHEKHKDQLHPQSVLHLVPQLPKR